MKKQMFGPIEVVFDGAIVALTLADASGANKVGPELVKGLQQAIDSLDSVDVAGIVLNSANRAFCVGADLQLIYAERDPARILALVQELHAALRALEKRAPVVAVLAGSALGGGYEIALAAHHRIAVDDPRVQVGLPEVMLGVIPGGGGTQRLSRMLGFQGALDVIVQGKVVRARSALKRGLVDELAPDAAAAMVAARTWIADNPRSTQPWDAARFRFPAPRPGTDAARNLFLAASAMVYKKTAGAFPAAETAVSVVQEGATVGFDRSLEVEARAFAHLVVSDQAKDMIRTLFFHKMAAEKAKGLPQVEVSGFHKVAVLGAGMMGAGLAFISAKAGYDVVLKDIHQASLDKGMAHVDQQIQALRHLDADARQTLRDRIHPTVDLEDLRGADLVIEAVFEDLALKHQVLREVEPLLAKNAVYATNTSALPITEIAAAAAHPDRLIGLHFFSPVEKMPLLEIIRGQATSDETLARCLHYNRAIKKLPIVVADGYGFYTSRVFSSYILEGAQLVTEGYDPVVVDWAARTAGMVVGPLQVFDEVTLKLGVHAIHEARGYRQAPEIEAVALVQRLVDEGRSGKAQGAGFYTYKEGKRRGIWSGLRDFVGADPKPHDVEEIQRRLLLVQVAEVGRALDEGVILEWRDAEVGAVFGIGFAPNTGGPLAFMDRYGMADLVEELDRRAAVHGGRYAPSPLMRKRAESGQRFF